MARAHGKGKKVTFTEMFLFTDMFKSPKVPLLNQSL